MRQVIATALLAILVQLSSTAYPYEAATYERAWQYGLDFTSGDYHTCTLSDTGVHCWGSNASGQLNVPRLVSPRIVSAGRAHTCALDAEGVKCWGDNRFGQLRVPPLSRPWAMTSGAYHTCVLEDRGAICWGDRQLGERNVPWLSRPTRITAGEGHTCAVDDRGLHCWGRTAGDEPDYPIPQLGRIEALTVGALHFCALDEGGVKCWGNNDHAQVSPIPELHHPRTVRAGPWFTCALDDDGVKCWGAMKSREFGVHGPEVFTVGDGFVCFLYPAGVRCTGDDRFGQLRPPAPLTDEYLPPFRGDFGLDHLERDLELLSAKVYPYKAAFLRKTMERLRKVPTNDESARLFVLDALAPVIEDIQTPLARTKVRPRLREALSRAKARLRVASLRETALNEATFRLSLGLSADALVVSREFVGDRAEREELERLLAEVANHLAQFSRKPVATHSQEVARLFREHAPLFERLSSGRRTAGLGVMLSVLTAFLGGQ